jgi:hypothetical protein
MISVGLSIRDAFRAPRQKLAAQPGLLSSVTKVKPDMLLTDAGIAGGDREAASSWLAGALAPPGDPGHDAKAADRLASRVRAVTPEIWPADLSAELETFRRMPQVTFPLSVQEIAVLVCSDTPDGLLAGVWNAIGLTGGDLSRVRYLADPGGPLGPVRGNALVVRVSGMDAGSASGFQQAMGGLGTLGRDLLGAGGLSPEEEFRFYLSGGFKAAIPYLIGLAEGLASLPEAGPVRAFVLHETSQQSPPIELPLRKMAPRRVREELAALTGQPSKAAPPTDFLDGYAYEQTSDGWQLTPFGVGLKALFGMPSPGLGP